MIITIDGPSASGKSTVARILAEKMGYYYLCSGLLYRALAYILLKKGYTLETIAYPLSEDIALVLDPQRFMYRYDKQLHERILYENADITRFLKDPTIDSAASLMSTNESVRDLLNTYLRTVADNHNVVTDGRDMGSIVFPHAQVKFYLTADPDVRALRWQLHQRKRGNVVSFLEAKKLITERDIRDSKRALAPLAIPQGAHVIDSSAIDAYETADEMMNIIRKNSND